MRSDRANDPLQAQIGLKNSVAADIFENVELRPGLRVHQSATTADFAFGLSSPDRFLGGPQITDGQNPYR